MAFIAWGACFARAVRHYFCSHHLADRLVFLPRLICLGATLLPLTHLHAVLRVTEKAKAVSISSPSFRKQKEAIKERLEHAMTWTHHGLMESTPGCITQPKVCQ